MDPRMPYSLHCKGEDIVWTCGKLQEARIKSLAITFRYSEAVQSAVANLSPEDLVRSIIAAGYQDLVESFSLEIPPAPEGEPTEAAAE